MIMKTQHNPSDAPVVFCLLRALTRQRDVLRRHQKKSQENEGAVGAIQRILGSLKNAGVDIESHIESIFPDLSNNTRKRKRQEHRAANEQNKKLKTETEDSVQAEDSEPEEGSRILPPSDPIELSPNYKASPITASPLDNFPFVVLLPVPKRPDQAKQQTIASNNFPPVNTNASPQIRDSASPTSTHISSTPIEFYHIPTESLHFPVRQVLQGKSVLEYPSFILFGEAFFDQMIRKGKWVVRS
jgi:hypothetical protein